MILKALIRGLKMRGVSFRTHKRNQRYDLIDCTFFPVTSYLFQRSISYSYVGAFVVSVTVSVTVIVPMYFQVILKNSCSVLCTDYETRFIHFSETNSLRQIHSCNVCVCGCVSVSLFVSLFVCVHWFHCVLCKLFL